MVYCIVDDYSKAVSRSWQGVIELINKALSGSAEDVRVAGVPVEHLIGHKNKPVRST